MITIHQTSGEHYPRRPRAGNNINPPCGRLHSVESAAAADGPGVRFAFFLAGCPLRCAYCHNPDTWNFSSGRLVTLDEAIAEVVPYMKFLRRAGGVTISGGEPLAQRDFTGALLNTLHHHYDLHTALDTSGFLGHRVSDVWLDAVDLVLLDIKHIDPDRYYSITRRNLAPTLSFAKRLARLRKAMWIRYVLVPDLTDRFDDIERLAQFLVSLGPAVERVDILPFHQLGAHKWPALHQPYSLFNTPPPTSEQMAAALRIFQHYHLPVC